MNLNDETPEAWNAARRAAAKPKQEDMFDSIPAVKRTLMKLPKLIRMHSSEGRTVDNKGQVVINTVTSFIFDTGATNVSFEIKKGDSVETIITTLIGTIELLKDLLDKSDPTHVRSEHEKHCEMVTMGNMADCTCDLVPT